MAAATTTWSRAADGSQGADTAGRPRPGVASRSSSGATAKAAVASDGPKARVATIQRTRLLAGAFQAVDELGYANTTVAHITRCARVSRRTFYELFANRDECLAAVLEDFLAEIATDLTRVCTPELAWLERVRLGLQSILSHLDREPRLARVCLSRALYDSPALSARREQIHARLADELDRGREQSARAAQLAPLTAEGLVGAVFTILQARLAHAGREPLSGLLGDLIAMIVLPYLGAAAARRERMRTVRTAPPVHGPAGPSSHATRDPFEGLEMRLTYRTARVLEVVFEHPRASNRLVAQCAGVSDQGQVSKLLARLERLDLMVNVGEGHQKGEPNSWVLTERGRQLAQSIRMSGTTARRAA